MTSFAKACVDLSNNLKYLCFSNKITIPHQTVMQHSSATVAMSGPLSVVFTSFSEHDLSAAAALGAVKELKYENEEKLDCLYREAADACSGVYTNHTFATDPLLSMNKCRPTRGKKAPKTRSDIYPSKELPSNTRRQQQPEGPPLSESAVAQSAIAMAIAKVQAHQQPSLTIQKPNEEEIGTENEKRTIHISLRMSELRSRYMNSCRQGTAAERSRSVSRGQTSPAESPLIRRRGASVAAIKQRLFSQGMKIDPTPADTSRPKSTRYRDFMRRRRRATCAWSLASLWQHEKTLKCLFSYLRGRDLMNCSLVCRRWLATLVTCGYFGRLGVRLDLQEMCRDLPVEGLPTSAALEARMEDRLRALYRRHLTQIRLILAKDDHMVCFMNAFATTFREFFPECFGSSIFSSGTHPLFSQESSCLRLLEGSFTSSVAGAAAGTGAFQSAPELVPTSTNATADATVNLAISTNNIQVNCHFCPTTTVAGPAGSPSDSLNSSDISCDSVFDAAAAAAASSLSAFGGPRLGRVQRTALKFGGGLTFENRFSTNHWSAAGGGGGGGPPLSASAPSQLPQNRTRHVVQLILDNCCLTDRSLKQLSLVVHTVTHLSLISCNDLTEMALWSCLRPWITNFSVYDCINFSDESLNAVLQLLPSLQELYIQAYHVSDLGLTYFTNLQRQNLRKLRLEHCLELTNHGMLNLVRALPHLQHLSLAGCSKLSDDAVDTICEGMRQLQSLDLSYISKLTDSGLECVACDLLNLETLVLDRL
uniref:F-box/LRR-repeat protein 16 n=1 Tax=Schistocephalus solidus TaxID=70667 RepID=A0A0X3PYR4_SCHSO